MNLLKTLLGAAVVVSAQMALAAPPSIMVLPEKNWCIEHGYTKTVKDKVYPDYEKAIGDKEFRSVNTAFQQLFAERGFPMVDARARKTIWTMLWTKLLKVPNPVRAQGQTLSMNS